MSAPPWGATVPGNRWDLAPTDAPPRSVSVVVPHFEQPRQLARTLAALARQDHPARLLEVIVADDGSAAPPVVPSGVRLVRQEDRGFRAAAARNLGAGAASGEILVFLDADTSPEPGFVSRISRLVAALPEAVVVGRRRHADLSEVAADVPVEVAGPAHELPEPAWLADGYRASRDLLDADDRSYRFVISAVLACSRWFFDEVGGFDETFVGYGGEDWEWAHRAWLAGAVLAHAPDAVAWHDGPDWAVRHAHDPAARAARTAETLRLARTIPVTGSRPRGLRWTSRPDVVVDARLDCSDAARFVTVDALLESLPEAVVVVPDAAGFDDPRVVESAYTISARQNSGDSDPAGPHEPSNEPGLLSSVADTDAAAARASTRVTVTVEHPVAFLAGAGAGFADAVRALGGGERGGLVARTADGTAFARAESSRAAVRQARWGTASAFVTDDVIFPDAALVGPAPNLEAWLGGWAGPEQVG